MPEETPKITVSHADLDAALEADAAGKVAAEPVKVIKEPEPPEPEPAKAIALDPDPIVEPIPEPEPEPLLEPDPEPAVPPEPDDHKERSKMGRRVAGLEQNLNLLVQKIDQLVTAKTVAEPVDPDDDEPVFMTKKQLREFVRTQAKDEIGQTKIEEQTARNEYENAYVSHVRQIGADLPPKQLDAVFKEMYDHHNEVIHKIPKVDADINFHRAVASLAVKSKPVSKVIPLKKDDPKNLGGPADTIIEGKKVEKPKLDEHAAAFARYHKLTDDQIASALSGETKLSLRGKL
uniref:Uncharacterized protein n=1 Tax=viral metagenome TaxID=1070528 RepID=A0A6M3XR07_9ZZZZ